MQGIQLGELRIYRQLEMKCSSKCLSSICYKKDSVDDLNKEDIMHIYMTWEEVEKHCLFVSH